MQVNVIHTNKEQMAGVIVVLILLDDSLSCHS